MSRVVRVLAVFAVVLTLISWGFGIYAILHPANCPGAFIGCSGNGGESSYYFAYLVCIITVVASILALIVSERRPEQTGKWLFRLLLAVSLPFFPLIFGVVISIFLGIFAYLLIPLCINLLILAKKWEEVEHTDTVAN